MKEPVLVVMAAGMGSRYGGLKQIDPVDQEGHIIMDFSIYDAVRAGFKKVIFIIKKENEQDFRDAIGVRLSDKVVLSCAGEIDGPFVVINADDYYGTHAFKMAYDFLIQAQEDTVPAHYMMVGYRLENTLTDNGYVSRGVCETDENGYLADINERTHIEKRDGGAAYTEDYGKTWTSLPGETPVSMNMWGFTGGFMKELVKRFPVFLEKSIPENPLKCEYFLPFVVDELLQEKKAAVRVLTTQDKWYGVTYKEDKPVVVAAIQNLKDQGLYPQGLWD